MDDLYDRVLNGTLIGLAIYCMFATSTSVLEEPIYALLSWVVGVLLSFLFEWLDR